MRRWQIWVAALVLLASCGFGTAVLVPIFASARAATRRVEELKAIKTFKLAVLRYAEIHQGKMPGQDWKRQIEGLDPTVERLLDHKEDDGSVGLAVLPNVMGKRLDDLPDDMILFVGYKSSSSLDVLHDVADLGHPFRTGNTIVLTVKDIGKSRDVRFEPVARVGYELAEQGVKLDR